MKLLKTSLHDSGNCRLYVKDKDNNSYVILDHGKMSVVWGQRRFELHTCTKDGEPCTPVKPEIQWLLPIGVGGTEFVGGLTGGGVVTETMWKENNTEINGVDAWSVYRYLEGDIECIAITQTETLANKIIADFFAPIGQAELIAKIHGNWFSEQSEDQRDAFHDVCVEALDVSLETEHLRLVFERLPDVSEAREWGLSDTPFKDKALVHIRDNSTFFKTILSAHGVKF